MPDLFTDTLMEGQPPTEQAKRALKHILTLIRDDPYVAWYLGLGTQTFALATEAYATLEGITVADARGIFNPRDCRNPAAQQEEAE